MQADNHGREILLTVRIAHSTVTVHSTNYSLYLFTLHCAQANIHEGGGGVLALCTSGQSWGEDLASGQSGEDGRLHKVGTKPNHIKLQEHEQARTTP